jgi:hypothetical protein
MTQAVGPPCPTVKWFRVNSQPIVHKYQSKIAFKS